MAHQSYQPELLAAAIEDGEVAAAWAGNNLGAFRLIDVREPHELEGPLGRVAQAQNIPMLQLIGEAQTLDPNVPMVLLCRSGRRSMLATEALRRAGIRTVASVEGGMLAWNVDVLGNNNVVEDERVANTHNLSEAVYRTNGLPEVSGRWVQNNLGRFRLFDIRGANELQQHGRVGQSEHVPMQAFMAQADKLDPSAPIVVMCASGGRSGRVVRVLEASGFTSVASLEGGLFGWRAQGLPTV